MPSSILWRILYNTTSTIVQALIVAPSKVKINCSKFIIDGLQRRCHMALLASLFVTLRNLLFGVFLPRKIITILRKITINFSCQWGVYFSQWEFWNILPKSFKSTCSEILKKPLLQMKWFLRFSVRFFEPIYTNLFAAYMQTYFVFVFVFVSSNVHEVIRAISNLFIFLFIFFFHEKILTHKNYKKVQKTTKTTKTTKKAQKSTKPQKYHKKAQKAQNAKQATFFLLNVFMHLKMLPFLSLFA